VPSRVFLVWLLTCGIWSTVWLFIKIGVTDVPPLTFAAFRLLVAVAIMVPATMAFRVPRPAARSDRFLIAWTGFLLLAVNYALLYWGMQFTSSGLTAVLQAMTPVFGFVFAHLFLHDEKMTLVKGGALLLGIVGVGIIFSHQLDTVGRRSLLGGVSIIASAACVAISYVAMRKRAHAIHPAAITTGQMVSAVVPLLLFAVWAEGNPLRVAWSARAALSVGYLALAGSIAGAWLNFWLLKRIASTQLLVMGLIQPLIAVMLGSIFLDETLSARAIVGGVAILVSVAFVMDVVPIAQPRSER
jgi:drug/metabolite transporter (DMT)-like permease